jgi:hypothetical protein
MDEKLSSEQAPKVAGEASVAHRAWSAPTIGREVGKSAAIGSDFLASNQEASASTIGTYATMACCVRVQGASLHAPREELRASRPLCDAWRFLQQLVMY